MLLHSKEKNGLVRDIVLSSFVAPTQHAGNQLRAYGAAGGRNAGELVLLGTIQAHVMLSS